MKTEGIWEGGDEPAVLVWKKFVPSELMDTDILIQCNLWHDSTQLEHALRSSEDKY